MKILITGASGFLGSNIARALIKGGHQVTGCVRDIKRSEGRLPGVRLISGDYSHDNVPEVWAKRLEGIDIVINAVGIIREAGENTFKALHSDTPRALFKACGMAGVKKVIQISAIGADDKAESRYHLTKKEADDYLKTLNLDWVIMKPSVVFGPGGKSAEFFTVLSALPVHMLIGNGRQMLQPVFVDDLAEAVVRIVDDPTLKGVELEAVGPDPLIYKDMLLAYRRWLGLGRAISIPTPLFLARLGAWFGQFIPSSPLYPETLGMLLRGNTGDPARLTKLLGRSPNSLQEGLKAYPSKAAELLKARISLLKPFLRLSIGIIWIFAGITSAFLYPKAESLALLDRVGLDEQTSLIALYAASALDFLIGLAVLAGFRPKITGIAQLILMMAYTFIISVSLPEFWLHPFGSVVKNLPLAAAILVLMAAEEVQ